MRKLAIVAVLSTLAAVPLAGPRPRSTLLFTVRNHVTSDPTITADGQRLYYWQDKTELYVFDRGARRSSLVIGKVAGAGGSLAVAPSGDLIAFTRQAEGGTDQLLWTLGLDPATGLAKGEPRRASILAANSPAFAPDGKSIAFATPTSRTSKNLVVIPANGGPERIVAQTQGDVWPIVWTKTDSMYFGISFYAREDASKNGVYRVSADGGKPQLVLHTGSWGNYPGLSPDGHLIVGYVPTWDTVIVASASGKRLQSYTVNDAFATPDVWSSRGRAVGSLTRKMHATRIVDLEGERQRIVGDTAELSDAIWSPDGRRVAAARRFPAAIVISDLAAGTRESIPVQTVAAHGRVMHWSPDGRYIAYTNWFDGIDLVDASTRTVRQLVAKSAPGVWPHWRSDSRALLYGAADTARRSDSTVRFDIHEVTLGGEDRTLHSIATRCDNADCGKIIDDSLMATWFNGAYSLTNFRARGTPRVVYTRDGFQAPQAPPVPSFSSNGRWMAVRHKSSTDQSWSIELMQSNGSAHRSVPLSFSVAPGPVNPWIADDGSTFIVASGGCVQMPSPTCADALTFYRVVVAMGKATAIASLPSTRNASMNVNAMISPDGRSLVIMDEVESRVDFYEIDFTDALKVAEQ